MNQKYLVVNDYTTGETHIINGWNDDDGEAIEEYLSDNYSDEIEWMLSYLKECERLRNKGTQNQTSCDEAEKDKTSRRNYVGYGAGYGILPSFEGGVGVSSHQRICENLGLKMSNITSTKTVDVHQVTKNKS